MSEFMHVSLRSRGRDQTSEWYTKNLGFEERRRGTTGIGTQTAILVLPGSETYIEVSDRVTKGHDFEIPEEAILLQIAVPDMRETYARLQKNGAKITEGEPDSKYVFVEDADGYEVELVKGKPGEPAKFASFGIRVSDLDKSANFYKDAIGFQEVRRWTTPRGTNIAVLELPGNTTTLALRHMPFLASEVKVPEDLMHMAFPVANTPTFIQTMRDRGYHVDEDSPRMSWLYDPDGYELEMIERQRS
jgi:lactoylglutathione lyase